MVQAYDPDDETIRANRRSGCLDKKTLMKRTELCIPGTPEAADCQDEFGHRLAKTAKRDYLPEMGKAVCGMTGVKEGTLLKSEVQQYMKNYCELDRDHAKCTDVVINTGPSVQGVYVPEKPKKSSDDGSVGTVLLSSSFLYCACCVGMIAMAMS